MIFDELNNIALANFNKDFMSCEGDERVEVVKEYVENN